MLQEWISGRGNARRCCNRGRRSGRRLLAGWRDRRILGYRRRRWILARRRRGDWRRGLARRRARGWGGRAGRCRRRGDGRHGNRNRLNHRQFERQLTVRAHAELVIEFTEKLYPAHHYAKIGCSSLAFNLRRFIFGDIKQRAIRPGAQ